MTWLVSYKSTPLTSSSQSSRYCHTAARTIAKRTETHSETHINSTRMRGMQKTQNPLRRSTALRSMPWLPISQAMLLRSTSPASHTLSKVCCFKSRFRSLLIVTQNPRRTLAVSRRKSNHSPTIVSHSGGRIVATAYTAATHISPRLSRL